MAISFFMSKNKTQIGVGSLQLTDSHKSAVMAVLDSNQLSPGPKVKEFEKVFAQAHGARYGLFVNSGTDALRIALAALKEAEGWNDGAGVIVPSVTFVATLNVILQANLRPVIADGGLSGFNLDRMTHFMGCTQQAYYKGCVAIMPVHLCGQRQDLTRLKAFAKPLNLKIIEDSCETMGVGPIQGDVACYSTYVCHLMTTGVGGLAITNNRELADLMWSYANHGRRAMGDFVFDRIGYSARATEIQAALGLEELKRLPDYIKARRLIAKTLIDALDPEFWNDLTIPAFNPDGAYMMFPIIIKESSKISRKALCQYLNKNGIETRPLLPLVNQPCYKKFGFDLNDYPQAKQYEKNGFYIGCHPGMSEDDVWHVIETFRRFFYVRWKAKRLSRSTKRIKTIQPHRVGVLADERMARRSGRDQRKAA
jgi:dTDP-4-amino-4,6-dideoxygalactose transaminase